MLGFRKRAIMHRLAKAFEPAGAINHTNFMASATPDLWLPSQPQSITANCTSTALYCLVTEEGVREWLAVLDSAVGESRTRDLSITVPTIYHHGPALLNHHRKLSGLWSALVQRNNINIQTRKLQATKRSTRTASDH